MVFSTRTQSIVLISLTFFAGLCSLVYELLISTTSSYFLGDSIRQFSLTIGMYMGAMGVGAYMSKWIQRHEVHYFVFLELILGLVGGLSIPILYMVYMIGHGYSLVMFSLIGIIGVITGLEIPLLARIMDKYYALKVNLAIVLSMDYVGALIGTLCFPFLLLPFLGVFKSSLLIGLLNLGIGLVMLGFFSDEFNLKRWQFFVACFSCMSFLFGCGLYVSNTVLSEWSDKLYTDRIIYTKQTPYQNIVMTKDRDDIRLFLDGNLQFSSLDEYRYHEVLVHVPMSSVPQGRRVLILGGGDGLALRELAKYGTDIHSITVVDLDPSVVALASSNPYLKSLNQGSFDNEKVNVHHQDAFQFLERTSEKYDVIIADLPDPNHISLARLYSQEFYRLVKKRLQPWGAFMTQSTSAYFSTEAFWCIVSTIESVGFNHVLPLHVYIPSFGEWGFVCASKKAFDPEKLAQVSTQFLDPSIIESATYFAKDKQASQLSISRLDNPEVLHYYLKGWQQWQ